MGLKKKSILTFKKTIIFYTNKFISPFDCFLQQLVQQSLPVCLSKLGCLPRFSPIPIFSGTSQKWCFCHAQVEKYQFGMFDVV
jgi:hypothetical protein